MTYEAEQKAKAVAYLEAHVSVLSAQTEERRIDILCRNAILAEDKARKNLRELVTQNQPRKVFNVDGNAVIIEWRAEPEPVRVLVERLL
jgi:hypothetical protein